MEGVQALGWNFQHVEKHLSEKVFVEFPQLVEEFRDNNWIRTKAPLEKLSKVDRNNTALRNFLCARIVRTNTLGLEE